MSGRFALAVALAVVLAGQGGAAGAAPPPDHVLPLGQYTSEKARRLATAHAAALRELDGYLYHCMPWVEVQKESIGFFRPKHVQQDDRYLSLRIFVEQEPSAPFATLRPEERAASMFSRYVGPVLRRMTRDPALVADGALDGFTVIIEWLKQASRAAGERPVHETIAVFLDRAAALEYLRGAIPIAELANRARVLGFDGETPLGTLRLSAWDDDFVSTYKVKNYQLAAGVSCS